MKIKRESLETIIAMHKNICDDKDIRTMSRVVAVFGIARTETGDASCRVAAYATDGVILARRELNETKTLFGDDNGLGYALSLTPLFVLETHVRAVEGVLKAFKHAREFTLTFVSNVQGDFANNCIIGVEGQSVQVELGVRGKVEGSSFEYIRREQLDALCEFKGTVATNSLGHETLVIKDSNCPLLGFNALLLVSLVKALGGSSKDCGCQVTLLQEQSLHKDGKQVSTGQMRVTRKDSKDVGVLCGMRF